MIKELDWYKDGTKMMQYLLRKWEASIPELGESSKVNSKLPGKRRKKLTLFHHQTQLQPLKKTQFHVVS